MRFVVDASVLGKILVPEADSERARGLVGEWMDGRLDLLAPAILPAEIASMLWKRVRRALLPVDQATRLYADFVCLGVPLAPLEDLAPAALEFALRYQQSVYDGLYLALAHETRSVLVTADTRLSEALESGPVEVRLLKDWTA